LNFPPPLSDFPELSFHNFFFVMIKVLTMTLVLDSEITRSACLFPLEAPPMPEWVEPYYQFETIESPLLLLYKIQEIIAKLEGCEAETKLDWDAYKLRVDACLNGNILKFNVNIYTMVRFSSKFGLSDFDENRSIVEFQRRSGCAVIFNSCFRQIQSHLGLKPPVAMSPPEIISDVNPDEIKATVTILHTMMAVSALEALTTLIMMLGDICQTYRPLACPTEPQIQALLCQPKTDVRYLLLTLLLACGYVPTKTTQHLLKQLCSCSSEKVALKAQALLRLS
jgi:hypothetical protein